MFESILVVCTGNICRSPIAERLLLKAMPTKNISSAGVAALVGKSVDSSAIQIAEKHGLSLADHVGVQFTSDLARKYSLILTMEYHQLRLISRKYPEASGKTMLLGHWIGEREIPDPYRKSEEAFEAVYQLIHQACLQWVEKLG
ncbi:low molecular weight protein-tyrosine-phosphatase [Sodalis sp. RH16]|uniref:low molecular weight protein-tyrosine-phosphatase n=1 Tax=Sodalis sp. RH16 TaxID=3394331 RepID=UPI0039B46674